MRSLLILLFAVAAHAVDVHVASSSNTAFSNADYYCDGVNDDVEIQSAVNFVKSNGGGTVYLSDGLFSLNTNIYLASNIDLVGQGMDSTTLQLAPNAPKFAKAGFMRCMNCVNNLFQDFTLDGNNALSTNSLTNYGRFGIYTEASNYTVMQRVRTMNWFGYGFDPHGTGGTTLYSWYLTVTDCEAINNGWDGFTIDKTMFATVANNRAIGNGRHGINIVTGSKNGEFHDNYIENTGYNYEGTVAGCGIMIQNNQGYSTQDHVLYSNVIKNAAKGGLCLTDVYNIDFKNNQIESTNVCLRVKSITNIVTNSITLTDNICAGTILVSDTSGYVGPKPTFLLPANSKSEYVIAPVGYAGQADFVCTGVNDETTIMKAMTYLGTSGGTITLLAGTFNINNNLFMSSDVVIRGQGVDITVLRLQNNAAPWKIGTKSNAGLLHGYYINNITVTQLTVDGNRQNQPADEAYNYGKYGFYCEACNDVVLDTIKIKSNVGYGFDPHGTQDTNTFSNNLLIQNCISEDNGWDGYTIDQTTNAVLRNNVARNNGRHGINIVTGSNNVLIENNIIDNNGYFYYTGALGCGIAYQNNGNFGTTAIVAQYNTVTGSATSSICVRNTNDTKFIWNYITGVSTCIKYTNSSVIYLESNSCYNKKKINIVAPYSDVTLVNQTNVYYS
jgi:parallel beta-helix repeat protein